MKNFIFGAVSALLLVFVLNYLGAFPVQEVEVVKYFEKEVEGESQNEEPESNLVTIVLPEDLEGYSREMTRSLEEFSESPEEAFEYENVKVEYELSDYDLMRIGVSELTTQEGLLGGGPTRGVVKYLDIVDGTAYVVLDLDEDRWSGSSISIGRLRPLIERTLLEFAEVDEVEFGYSERSKVNLSL